MRLQTQLFLVAAALLFVSSGAAASGGLTGGAVGAMQLHTLRRVEDDLTIAVEEAEAEAAYPRRRMLYDQKYIGYNGLAASKAACYGSCPGRGQPYSGRGCKSIYQCG